MDQEEIAKVVRIVEERLTQAIEVQPGVRVQQCQWIFGKNASEANLLNVVCSLDPDMLNTPIMPELTGVHDVVDTGEQASWNNAFDDIVSGATVSEHEAKLQEAREEALRAAEELEGDF